MAALSPWTVRCAGGWVVISAGVDTLAKKSFFFCRKWKHNNYLVLFSFGAATQSGLWPLYA